jgi:hypothetical protein
MSEHRRKHPSDTRGHLDTNQLDSNPRSHRGRYGKLACSGTGDEVNNQRTTMAGTGDVGTFWTRPIAGVMVPRRKWTTLSHMLGVAVRLATLGVFVAAVFLYQQSTVDRSVIERTPRSGADCEVGALSSANSNPSMRARSQALGLVATTRLNTFQGSITLTFQGRPPVSDISPATCEFWLNSAIGTMFSTGEQVWLTDDRKRFAFTGEFFRTDGNIRLSGSGGSPRRAYVAVSCEDEVYSRDVPANANGTGVGDLGQVLSFVSNVSGVPVRNLGASGA